MKITNIQCHMVTIPYRNPYRMAPGETRHKKQIVVLVETDDGITGVGETGVTLVERGGETQEAIYITIRKYFTPLLLGMDPFDIGPIIDRYPIPRQMKTLHLRRERLARLLGLQVPDSEVARILGRLGLTVTPSADGWDVKAPTFRVDLLREVDLIEEVGRHYGFDKLEPSFPPMFAAAPPPDPRSPGARACRC